jgi:hypothetical protein
MTTLILKRLEATKYTLEWSYNGKDKNILQSF